MKKVIATMVLTVGVLFTSVGYSNRALAGDATDKTHDLLQKWGCTLREVSRFDGSDQDQCNVSDVMNWDKIDIQTIDFDLVLNSMAAFFSCVDRVGRDSCGVHYCKCVEHNESLGLDTRVCKSKLLRCVLPRI